MTYQNTLEFAKEMDQKDPLRDFRKQFHMPMVNGKVAIYFTGNSLGLQPIKTKENILQELDDWAKWGVEGHFHGKNPWYAYHELFSESAAQIVGALPHEVVMMNGLTTNLHLMMVSFYEPKGNRNKILCEAKAFPSDAYALESQIKFHNLDPEDCLIEIAPRPGEHTINQIDILEAIEQHKDEIALIMIGGVNYYTGQVFDMAEITQAGHDAGAKVGFDLAHAAGNIPLKLHEWGPDFACWCTYKYLNSGPGGISGVFVHDRHAKNPDLKRFAGWWGYDKESRFEMEHGFKPIAGAEGWQLSNAPVFAMAPHKAALELHVEAGMDRLRAKSIELTAYFEFVIKANASQSTSVDFEIITPSHPDQRCCQLSVLTHGKGKELFDIMTEKGVIADWREPNVIRMAAVPLYNSFEDVYQFGQILLESIS